jgi:hypothetical protein
MGQLFFFEEATRFPTKRRGSRDGEVLKNTALILRIRSKYVARRVQESFSVPRSSTPLVITAPIILAELLILSGLGQTCYLLRQQGNFMKD